MYPIGCTTLHSLHMGRNPSPQPVPLYCSAHRSKQTLPHLLHCPWQADTSTNCPCTAQCPISPLCSSMAWCHASAPSSPFTQTKVCIGWVRQWKQWEEGWAPKPCGEAWGQGAGSSSMLTLHGLQVVHGLSVRQPCYTQRNNSNSMKEPLGINVFVNFHRSVIYGYIRLLTITCCLKNFSVFHVPDSIDQRIVKSHLLLEERGMFSLLFIYLFIITDLMFFNKG